MTFDRNTPPDDDSRDGLEKAMDRIGDLFDKAANLEFVPKKNGDDAPGGDADKFFRAVRANRQDEVRALLAQGQDPNAHGKGGDTALHISARENLCDMIRLLVDNGAVPTLGKKGAPAHAPIEEAINYGKAEAVETLAQMGGYIPGKHAADGWSVLHRAADKGKTSAVRALLKAGADANERTGNGATPLLISIQSRQQEVTDALLDFPSVVEGMGAFYMETDDRKRTAFHLAVERGSAKAALKMIEKGALVNQADAEGLTPIQRAVSDGDCDMVAALIRAGADLNRTEGTGSLPLLLAAGWRNIPNGDARGKIVALLLHAGADPEIQSPFSGATPLHLAAQAADGTLAVKALLEHGVSLERRDKTGATPVFHALKKGQEMTLESLLQAGADPNARHGEDASTPLITAARSGLAAAVRMLIAHRADPALCDSGGKSALYYARKSKDAAMINLLETALRDRQVAERTQREKQAPPKNGDWTL